MGSNSRERGRYEKPGKVTMLWEGENGKCREIKEEKEN